MKHYLLSIFLVLFAFNLSRVKAEETTLEDYNWLNSIAGDYQDFKGSSTIKINGTKIDVCKDFTILEGTWDPTGYTPNYGTTHILCANNTDENGDEFCFNIYPAKTEKDFSTKSYATLTENKRYVKQKKFSYDKFNLVNGGTTTRIIFKKDEKGLKSFSFYQESWDQILIFRPARFKPTRIRCTRKD